MRKNYGAHVLVACVLTASLSVALWGCGSREEKLTLPESATQGGDPTQNVFMADSMTMTLHRPGCPELKNVPMPQPVLGAMAAMGNYRPCPVCMVAQQGQNPETPGN